MFLLFLFIPIQEPNYHSFIYIPICFYYFREFGVNEEWLRTFTFQYVSIISEGDRICNNSNRIYIPICFYYFQKRLFVCRISMGYLHSNMFLLFRTLSKEVLGRLSEFTFQYVSIISDLDVSIHFNAFEFTFQYVSIISASGCVQNRRRAKIYIPICFYYF